MIKKKHKKSSMLDEKEGKKKSLGSKPEKSVGKKAKKLHGKAHSYKPGFDNHGKFAPGNKIGPRIQPGQVLNPTGRAKKSALDYATEAFMEKEIKWGKTKKGKKRRKQVAKILVEALFHQAVSGKKGIAQLLYERTGGKPSQTIDAKFEEVGLTHEQRKARISELLDRIK